MKAVLISIQPKWCEFIASGKKTVEVRKTKPKIETPFKCYIYCTSSNVHECLMKNEGGVKLIYACNYKTAIPCGGHIANGKVIGEFVCDKIIKLNYSCGSYRCEGLDRIENDRIASASQLSLYDMKNYLICKDGYAWHISDLVIYDKPKELSEFFHACDKPKGTDCSVCLDHRENKCKAITRPPQSYMYVEELR